MDKYEIIIKKMDNYIKILNNYLEMMISDDDDSDDDDNKKGINVDKIVDSINMTTEDIQNVFKYNL